MMKLSYLTLNFLKKKNAPTDKFDANYTIQTNDLDNKVVCTQNMIMFQDSLGEKQNQSHFGQFYKLFTF